MHEQNPSASGSGGDESSPSVSRPEPGNSYRGDSPTHHSIDDFLERRRESRTVSSPNAVTPPSGRAPASLPRGCSCGVILLTLFVGAVFCCRIAYRNHIGPAQAEEMRRIEKSLVEIPAEWKKPEVLPSPDVVRFHNHFADEIKSIREMVDLPSIPGSRPAWETTFTQLANNDALTSSDRESLAALAIAMAPIIAETSAAVHLPTYTVSMDKYTTAPSLPGAIYFGRYCAILAMLHSRNGEVEDAFQLAMLPISLVKHDRPAWQITDLIAIAVINKSLSALNEVIARCDDPRLLVSLLHQLEAVDCDYRFKDESLFNVVNMIASLRRVGTLGYPVRLDGQTEINLRRQNMEIYGPKYRNWALAHLAPFSDAYKVAAEQTDSGSEDYYNLPIGGQISNRRATAIRSGIFAFLTGYSWDALEAYNSRLNYGEFQHRAAYTVAYLNLTLTHIAERLHDLNAAPVYPDKSGIEAYLQTIPADPFSSGPLCKDEKTGQWSSVGPDMSHDYNSIIYDPSNGTVSPGDIFIKGSTR